MPVKTIYKLCGLAGITGGVVIVLFNILQLLGLVDQSVDNVRAFFTLFLWIFALMGIYARQAHRAGVLGLTGFALALIALVMNVCFRYTATFFVPVLSTGYPEAMAAVFSGAINTAIMTVFVIYALGFLLFGIGTLRAGVFPKWAAWLFLVGPLLNFAGSMTMLNLASQAGTILTGIALVGLGWSLWQANGEMVPAASPQPAI